MRLPTMSSDALRIMLEWVEQGILWVSLIAVITAASTQIVNRNLIVVKGLMKNDRQRTDPPRVAGRQGGAAGVYRRGIVLQCPFCGMTPRFMAWYGTCSISCSNYQCAAAVTNHCFADAKEAVKHWNTRQAPPIRRCKDCINATNPGSNIVFCDYFERDMMPDDFCSCFEPREE